jgi:hypothetical protein
MSQSYNVVGTTPWELGDIQEVVGFDSKVTWGYVIENPKTSVQ